LGKSDDSNELSQIQPRILGVEDDGSQHWIIDRIVRGICPEWKVEWVTTSDAATALLSKNRYDLVIADYSLGMGDSGLDLWKRSRVQEQRPPFVFVTSVGIDVFIRGVGLGETCPTVLNKPVYPGEAAQVIRNLLVERRRS
jgi:DNA-binding response OmpR family regulator